MISLSFEQGDAPVTIEEDQKLGIDPSRRDIDIDEFETDGRHQRALLRKSPHFPIQQTQGIVPQMRPILLHPAKEFLVADV